MNETEFRNWLVAQGQVPGSVSTRLSDLRRIEKHFGDVDEAFRTDKFAAILSKLAYTVADRDAGKANESGLKIDGDVYDSLSTLRSCLALYARLKGEEDMDLEPKSQAGRIRRFVLERYAEPARQRGESAFTVRVGDVHREMGLSNAMPAVCSALDSEKRLMLLYPHHDDLNCPEGVTSHHRITGSDDELLTATVGLSDLKTVPHRLASLVGPFVSTTVATADE